MQWLAGFITLVLGFHVTLYATDEELDPTFHGYGLSETNFGYGFDSAQAVAIQRDGKIVVAGWAYSGSNDDFALARYLSNGSLDTTFGTGGKVMTPIGISVDRIYDMALQSDGKIVVVGHAWNGFNNDFAIARYEMNGSLDTTFGGVGSVITDINGSLEDYAKAVAIGSDGKIIVAGFSDNGSRKDIALVRYLPNGTLDTAFGNGGKIHHITYGGTSEGWAVALQSDGKIVVAGTKDDGTYYNMVAVRFLADGTPDSGFGYQGIVTVHVATHAYAYDLAIQRDGKIVLAGDSLDITQGYEHLTLSRLNSDGTLDTTFHTNGYYVLDPLETRYSDAKAVALTCKQEIIAAGALTIDAPTLQDFFVYHLDNADFGSNGSAFIPAIESQKAYDMAIQKDGKIVIVGEYNGNFGVARFLNKGCSNPAVLMYLLQ